VRSDIFTTTTTATTTHGSLAVKQAS